VVEHLPSKCKSLNSNPSIVKKQKEEVVEGKGEEEESTGIAALSLCQSTP
jgi:hypothetical protein